MILDSKNKSIEVKLAGAVTTNQLPITGGYKETNIFGKTSINTTTNSTTAVTVVPGPDQGARQVYRELDLLSIPNVDTAAATVIIQINNNSTIEQSQSYTLSVGDILNYNASRGFYVNDKYGNLKQSPASISYSIITGEVPSGTINGSNTAFTIANSAIANSEEVFYNGQRLRRTSDYSVSGTSLTMVWAPETGSDLRINYRT